MKSFLRPAFLALSFLTSTMSAWHPLQAILNLLSDSIRIPQFILDTRHPWLEQNRAWLSRLDDTEQALCSLDSDLRPGNGGNWTYPADLFKNLIIDNNRVGASQTHAGWANADARLKEILRCPAALQDVETFKIVILNYDGKFASLFRELPAPPPALPTLFLKVLSSMPNLQKLDWETFNIGTDVFRQVFTDSKLMLPTVRHLRTAKFMDFLVKACPNIEILESGGSRTTSYWRDELMGDPTLDLIQSARALKNLSTLKLYGQLDLSHLKALVRATPNITNLQIDGELVRVYSDDDDNDHDNDDDDDDDHNDDDDDHNDDDNNDDDYYLGYMTTSQNLTLETYVAVLNQLPRLDHLRLPRSSGLCLGFEGGSGCGNAYFGSGGREYGRSVSQAGAKTTERAAEIVLNVMPNLKALSFGCSKAQLLKGEGGQVYATWPWTGRMTEWTYEEWPEPSEASSEG